MDHPHHQSKEFPGPSIETDPLIHQTFHFYACSFSKKCQACYKSLHPTVAIEHLQELHGEALCGPDGWVSARVSPKPWPALLLLPALLRALT